MRVVVVVVVVRKERTALMSMPPSVSPVKGIGKPWGPAKRSNAFRASQNPAVSEALGGDGFGSVSGPAIIVAMHGLRAREP
jgi:hypothetical protein